MCVCLVAHSSCRQLATSRHHIHPAEIFSSCTSGEGQDYHWLGQGSKVNRWTMRQPQLTGPKVNIKVTWLTWFLTGVTTPFCLQSMASGTDCRLPRWPVPLRVAEQSWNRKIPIVINKQLYDCVPLHTWGAITYLGCHEVDLLEFLKFHVSKIIQFHCGSKNHSISLGNYRLVRTQRNLYNTHQSHIKNKYQISSMIYDIYATYKVKAQSH